MTKKELRNMIREVVEQEVDQIIEDRAQQVVYEMLFGQNSYLSEVIEKTLRTQGEYLTEVVSQTLIESTGVYTPPPRPKPASRLTRAARMAKDVVPSHLREAVHSAPSRNQPNRVKPPVKESKESESAHSKYTKDQLNLDDPGIDENILAALMTGQLGK